ncbi:MAG: sigma 54-interacting transcriptional regulator [Candidatus Acidiferrales bacterium]
MATQTKNTGHAAAMTGENCSYAGGISAAIRTLVSVITELAPTNIPILLVGESGTGKQIFARRIHQMSARQDEPFVKISCASVNADSLGAELGLNGNGNGDAPHAARGTVFFDEISELDAACQRSLLCSLPDGDSAAGPGTLSMRVISATSRNLDEEMHAGRFRSELYYRINGVCLRVPPLRERKEDIPELVDFFLTKYAAQLGRSRPLVTAPTFQNLMEHSWPGNIRELENVVKKVVALGDEHFALTEPVEVPATPSPADTQAHSLKAASRAASREAERELILKTLSRTRWNRKRAAQELQISYKSLLYKLKQIGLDGSGVA